MANVREAVPSDAPAVEAVWTAVAAEGKWIGAELPLRADWSDRFRTALVVPESSWFVTEAEGEVVGGAFVHAERGVAHLGMAILDGYRGVGRGRLLLNATVDWARHRGCHKVTLEVWPHNTRARRLYESVGFAEEGYLRRHYRRRNGALWDAVTMGLVLDNDSPGHP